MNIFARGFRVVDSLCADPDARRLAERLAGLPLALATAGAYLRLSRDTPVNVMLCFIVHGLIGLTLVHFTVE